MAWSFAHVSRASFAAVTLGFAATVFAYEFQRQRGDPERLPGGPWIETASNVTMLGNRLCANLKQADGTFAPDESCTYVQEGLTFTNKNGSFERVIVDFLPGGTWVKHARNAYREGNRFFAQLRRFDGTWADRWATTAPNLFYENNDGYFRLQPPGCSTLGYCLEGYVLKLDAFYVYCEKMTCDYYNDLHTCCDVAEPCSNVTWCPPQTVPHPYRYCPAINCDYDRDVEFCCPPEGVCSAMQCLKGFTHKLDASTRWCPRYRCDPHIDGAHCCDVAEPCGVLGDNFGTDCPFGYFFNLDDFCDGVACEEPRDRMKCCQKAIQCDHGFECPYGFLSKNDTGDGDQHFCDGVRPHGSECKESLDTSTCCNAAAPCSDIQCPFGFYDVLGLVCGYTSCDYDRDVADCCARAEPCTGIASWENKSCGLGMFFNITDYCDGNPCVESRDWSFCCQPSAPCATYGDPPGTCPYTYAKKPRFDDLYCAGIVCEPDRDLLVCCDEALVCTSRECPRGYVPRGNQSTIYCLGPTCEFPRDTLVCCEPAQLCDGHYNCPHGYIPKHYEGNYAYCGVNFEGATTCDVDRDLNLCCDEAMICSNFSCNYGEVTIPRKYCNGTSCILSRDYDPCCEVGLNFLFYRFVPTLLRKKFADAVQIADILFYFHDILYDTSNDFGFSVNGWSPWNEQPRHALDNTASTKWLDYYGVPLYLRAATPRVIDSYTWRTGDDLPMRDPIHWRLEASEDNVTYILLHEWTEGIQEAPYITGYAPHVPLERHAELARMHVPIPCLAPRFVDNARNVSCVEGKILRHGQDCTPLCEFGFEPHPSEGINCTEGEVLPEFFCLPV